jgi:uracil-DNA glycosylase
MTVDTGIASLRALARAEAECTRCPLYRNATQAVPGEGPKSARIMVVGEQPGDKEDLAGKPFVGPAGLLFDTALDKAGIPRNRLFVTNAVKHFKFAPRGKRRMHQKPNAGEIESCKWWLDQERALVAPAVLLAMGATAVRGVFGRSMTITSLRGKVSRLDDGTAVIVTIHPSYLLRMPDAGSRDPEMAAFIADLKRAWALADRP